MPALVVSSRLTDRRRRALAPLLPAGLLPTWTGPGAPLPPLEGVRSIVVDGPWGDRPASEAQALGDAVRAGASLVAIGAVAAASEGPVADLLGSGDGDGAGAGAGPALAGEYIAALDPDHPLTARLGHDLTVVDRPTAVGAGPLAVLARLGFAGRPVVAAGRRGAGQVLLSGLGNTDEALACPELARLLGRALAPPLPAGPVRPLGLGVLGFGPFGGMGTYHGRAAEATAGLEFVATCDSDDARRKQAEHDFPGVSAYADAAELAADPDVDVVVVATPPVSHAGLVLDMLRAGKHVVCEKPLCLTRAEADQLMAAATEAGRALTVHQNRRWDADFLALRRAVEAGLLGEVFNVETFVGGFAHPCRAWHSEVSVSGGAVYDWGSHHIDWVLALLGGPPRTVHTAGHKRVWHDVTNLDQVRVRMTWDDGREAEFFQSDVAAVRRPKFFVQGTAGTLVGHYRTIALEHMDPPLGLVSEVPHHAEAPAELLLARYESGQGVSEARLPLAPVPPFAFHRNLADHLHLGEPLAVRPEQARSVVAVLEAAQRSSDDGNVAVTLPAG